MKLVDTTDLKFVSFEYRFKSVSGKICSSEKETKFLIKFYKQSYQQKGTVHFLRTTRFLGLYSSVVEQRTENSFVSGSNPFVGINKNLGRFLFFYSERELSQ